MTTLKGIFPETKLVRRKNFIYENVKNLRRMEQCIHVNKDSEEATKVHLCKQEKTGERYKVSARVNSGFRSKKADCKLDKQNASILGAGEHITNRKSSAPVPSKNGVSCKHTSHSCTNASVLCKQKKRERKVLNKHSHKIKEKVLSDPNLLHTPHEDMNPRMKLQTKYRSQAIQTLDSNEINDIYSEGLIRYPSKKSVNKNASTPEPCEANKSSNLSTEGGDDKVTESPKGEKNVESFESSDHKNDVDYIKLNKERTSVASRMAMHVNNSGALPANYRKGVVPKYIKNRKEAQEKEEKEKAEAFDPDCPESHIALPDNERQETLHMLKKSYQEYVKELNMMPIKTDTLRAQRRKMEIEKQLNKLEEGMKVFSRPKVYVKVNV